MSKDVPHRDAPTHVISKWAEPWHAGMGWTFKSSLNKSIVPGTSYHRRPLFSESLPSWDIHIRPKPWCVTVPSGHVACVFNTSVILRRLLNNRTRGANGPAAKAAKAANPRRRSETERGDGKHCVRSSLVQGTVVSCRADARMVSRGRVSRSLVQGRCPHVFERAWC